MDEPNEAVVRRVSIKRAAELLDTSYATIYQAVMACDLPAAQLGTRWKIRLVDLEAWFESVTISNGAEIGTPHAGDIMNKLTPIDQWANEIGKSPRWVRDHINAGDILAVKIGGSYFMTDELISEMSARAAGEPAATEDWGQVTRVTRTVGPRRA